ncbi:UNVERIFIED_CONTAM: hypothetical protein Slati_2359900 [Sesamum latifolium]|uniref:Uncharacterized protein n=1 Tax=Sesamum latifolium TaxID=2727402 RepID=A0AAW2WAM6_9LAMI
MNRVFLCHDIVSEGNIMLQYWSLLHYILLKFHHLFPERMSDLWRVGLLIDGGINQCRFVLLKYNMSQSVNSLISLSAELLLLG